MASMSGYTKLFNSILASTVWREPNEVRIVWITLLAMADKEGIAEGSVPGIADFARIPVEATRTALERLSMPDPDSRSQEHDGRRIQAVDGGWQLLNHAKYRAKMGADERREYNRLKQAQHRERQHQSIIVNDNVHCQDNTEAEAEAEAEAESKPSPPVDDFDQAAWTRWTRYRRDIRKPLKPASILAAQRKLATFGCDQSAVVEQSIANGWTGIFQLKNGGTHATHQHVDNSAPARVKRANERQREAERRRKPIDV